MKEWKEIKNYRLIERKMLDDLHTEGCLLEHIKTGARVSLLLNDDPNKVFYIGFRTPPEDSTGIAHILEHSVLCGSRKFPVKDPFVELAKGSLNTFLNAMTYPDKTVYPVASCNDKDFANLMDVYLDAVFYPNIAKEPKIFMQEGWHYEMESAEDELTMNGVVYNEMKGAFSSPDDVLERNVFSSLFPDTAYGVESGGDPENIPDLTYEQFLAFHQQYYHPSNSYIYLYGNLDPQERLAFIDREYLSSFEKESVESEIAIQSAFEKPLSITKEYPVMEEESLEEATYFSYNCVVGESYDRELYIAFQVLDYALCNAPGAPIKQKLIDLGIGKDVYSQYENGIRQPFFSVIAKGASQERLQEFVETVEAILSEQSEAGIQRKSLEAALNVLEFKYREADFGSYPKGLIYGLQMLDSWLYHDDKPFIHLESADVFDFLRKQLETDYYEKLIQKHLLQNNHKSILMVLPVPGLTDQKERESKSLLAQIKSAMSAEDIERVVTDTKELLRYQETPDSVEDIRKLPHLSREDLDQTLPPLINQEMLVMDSRGHTQKILFHDIFTSGIAYVRLLFSARHIAQEQLGYLGLLPHVLGYVDTTNYTYSELNNEIHIHTGGMSAANNSYLNSNDAKEYGFYFEIATKVLYPNLHKAFHLLSEVLSESKLEDTKRLREIIAEIKSRMQASMMSAGHTVAASRASSYFSETALLGEMTKGIEFYRFVEDLDRNFEERKDSLVHGLQEVASSLFAWDNLLMDCTATKDGYDLVTSCLDDMELVAEAKKSVLGKLSLSPVRKQEGFKTSAQVQYVCMAGNYAAEGLSYTGALLALRVILGYNYLWSNVRVKGGAYGCMNAWRRSGACFFVSYRDPNLESTLRIYKDAADYVSRFDADEEEMTKYVIGAVSDLDTPLNPAAQGARSLHAYLTDLSWEQLFEERRQLLTATAEDIRELSVYVEALRKQDCICVVGNAQAIETNREIFDETTQLFHN